MGINPDRIVPVAATDLLSLYAFIMEQAGKTVNIVGTENANGVFEITEAVTDGFMSEPVGRVNFGEGVTTSKFTFAPAYDFAGFTAEGEPVEMEGEVIANPANLYSAELKSGKVTVEPVTPSAPVAEAEGE